MEEWLVYLAVLYQGDYRKIKKAVYEEQPPDLKRIKEVVGSLKCKYTTILSNDYPSAFRSIKDPPFVLFYYGDLSLVQQPCISMVGMREPTQYGKDMAKHLSYQLGADFVIVSGMALGIDAICHQYAKKTIAVLGCGIDYCYPKSNYELYERIKAHHLVISEYPRDVKPQRYYFPWRNRLVAGLGLALIVVQAYPKSGTMITVGYALEQGKTVFALPCRLGDPSGTLGLIKDGAAILMDVKDIYEELNLLTLYQKD